MSKTTEKPDMDSELGTLIVVLLKARNLNDKHSFRKQDVFAQATLNGVQKRSHVDIRGGQHPEWDSEIRFTVLKANGPGGKNRKLEVACYSQESRREDLLGKATVDISDTLRTGEFDDWVSLDVDGVMRGDIYLEMTYYASAPAPAAAPNNKFLMPVQGSALGRRPSKLSPSDRLSRPIQQSATGPSRFSSKQPSRPHDQPNPTPSHLNNTVSPISKNDSLSTVLVDEPVHVRATLSSTRDQRSLSPPQTLPSQLAVLPSILRPGLGGRSSPMQASEPHQQCDFGHSRTLSESSISSSRLHSTTSDASLLPPNPYTGGSSVHIQVNPGLSNIDGPLYTRGSGGHTAGQQHQQVSGGRAYSPAPPGAFIPENQPGPDGRSYCPASRVQTSGPSNHDGVVSPNPYTGDIGAFVPGGQHQPTSGERAYSPAPPTLPSVPISVSPPNPYTGNGGVYLPENQLGPNVPSYSLIPSSSVWSSRSSNIDHSAPIDPYTGGSGAFTLACQQAPDGRAYSSAPPVRTAQTSQYANYVTSVHTPIRPSLPCNAGTGSSSVPSELLALPIPVIPVVMEPYGYHEPSSHMRPGPGGRSESSYYQPPLPPPRMSPVSSNRSEQEAQHDPYHMVRYQTPLPLPPGSVKESPLPPLPPPPAPVMDTPAQVSSSPPAVVAPALSPNTSRIEALRKVEQDAVYRKEQELKDLELAMQLDRELNL